MLIPWQRSKPLTCDVTVAHTLADSYVSVTARSGGAAAEQAAGRKTAKYDHLVQTGRLFQPIAAETLGPLNESSIAFFSELGRKTACLFQETTESPAFFSSAYQSQYSASTPSCSTTASLATRSDHFSFSFYV